MVNPFSIHDRLVSPGAGLDKIRLDYKKSGHGLNEWGGIPASQYKSPPISGYPRYSLPRETNYSPIPELFYPVLSLYWSTAKSFRCARLYWSQWLRHQSMATVDILVTIISMHALLRPVYGIICMKHRGLRGLLPFLLLLLRLVRHVWINISRKCDALAEIVSRVSRTILYRSRGCFGTEPGDWCMVVVWETFLCAWLRTERPGGSWRPD